MTARRITGTAVATLCTALALTGCSSSGSGAAKSGGSSSSHTAPSPSSSASSSSSSSSASSSAKPSAAVQKYEALTAPIDADLQGFLQLPNATPVSKVKAAAAKVAADERTLVTKLKSANWPSAVQPTIDQLEKSSTAERAVYLKCAAAPSVTAIKAILGRDKATIAARVAAASHVRVALGLPAGGAASSSTPA